MYINSCKFHKSKCGAAVESQVGILEIAESSPACAVLFAQDMACLTEDYACAVFWEALRHICVTPGA
jgi:hypothetical protein